MIGAWEWFLLFTLLLMSAFFSGSETALTSLSRLRVRHLVESGIPNAALVDDLLADPNRLLSTVLIGNNVVNISISALATSIALRLFGPSGVGIAIGALTIVMLIVGEITPKTYAATNGEKVSFWVARPILWLETLFSPGVKSLGALAALLVRVLDAKMPDGGIFVTEEEIRTMINLGENQGALEAQERRMITNVFELNDTLVREVMLPRTDLVAAPVDFSLKEALDTVVDTGHSRIPVYRNSLDNIIGIIHARDLMVHCRDLGQGTVREIMREPYFVPETKKVSELLMEMRQDRIHLAVVLDEYGGTAGVAFLEDLVETVIGEIGDEFDKFKVAVEKIGPREIRASARVSVDELLDVDLPQDDFDSIGGLVFHLFGRVPVKSEAIEFDDLTLTVEEVEQNRIKIVRVMKK